MKRKKQEAEDPHRSLVEATYYRYEGRYGYRQLQLFIHQDHGVWLNHKKVLRLMQSLNIRSRIRRKHRCNYISTVGGRVAGNLLQRQFQADKPNKKWVTDVTQYRVGDICSTFQQSRICLTTRLWPTT
ncbi:IS3 family transposase [Paenibacillus donghaensis]|uniref:IS3 family transposase n=1 Tax=Paenibacillus donghaensis TaxID=414771 RepID=UPI0012F79BF4